ncbi:ATP adenylyltransferase [Kipferlia bialata]|uniref:ATP adenylyltransferase n=1 Tax=Kipferlia bialata TaxID=797122 RepID=A0A9K3CSE1_9EUKA|nr:ATP adenylyltransferase [Kipferlia bialata]|eukprot:g1704.t1
MSKGWNFHHGDHHDLSSEMLMARVAEVTETAVESGALKSIMTETESVIEEGIEFELRSISSYRRKSAAKKARDPDFNPFLPFERALYVCDVPGSTSTPDGAETPYVCVLNKFNVVERHMLIITRAFELQTHALTLGDFSALAHVLREVDGLCFYNSGAESGASQRHKHMQLLPTSATPFDTHFQGFRDDTPSRIPALEFAHLGMNLPYDESTRPSGIALMSVYTTLMGGLGITVGADGESSAPYNMLATRHWMMLVPRTRESVCEPNDLAGDTGVSLNSLAFVGKLLVKDRAQKETLLRVGLMKALSSVTE